MHLKRGYYLLYPGAVAVVPVVEVIGAVVVVGADCTAGFGASCFWHPAKANTVATIAIEMIARIFFMNCSPPFIPRSNGKAFVWIRNIYEKHAAAENAKRQNYSPFFYIIKRDYRFRNIMGLEHLKGEG